MPSKSPKQEKFMQKCSKKFSKNCPPKKVAEEFMEEDQKKKKKRQPKDRKHYDDSY